MSEYIPVEVVIGILKRLPVKSLVKFRSVCKSWNTLICDPSFISTHLQASLSKPPNNTPSLLIECKKMGKTRFSLHYDNDGFDKFKQLQSPPFGAVFYSPVIGSCNGLICVQLFYYGVYDFIFVVWNPSIQKYISLPQMKFRKLVYLNVGFGFDSRTNDYKLIIFGVMDGSWIEPYLFSLNENCWRRVTAVSPNFTFDPVFGILLPFVNGAVHCLGYRERNNDGHNCAILGFDLSAEEFFEITLPERLFGLRHVALTIMKYGESSIAVTTHPAAAGLHELWVMKEYGVVDSWTKVLTLDRVDQYAGIPRVMGFRKNGEVFVASG